MTFASDKVDLMRWALHRSRGSAVLKLAALAIFLVALNGCDGPARGSIATVAGAESSRRVTPTDSTTTDAEVVVTLPTTGPGPSATSTRTVEVVVTFPPTKHDPRPARTRHALVGSEVRIVEYDCGRMTKFRHIDASTRRYGLGLLAWSTDGSGILFNYDGALWLADDVTGEIYYVLEDNPYPYSDDLPGFGYYADISPAGDRIAYTTCEFPQDVRAGDSYPAVAHEPGPPSANYDIVVGEIDKDGRHGITSNTRITSTSQRLDHFPVWSPRGIWIASLSMDRTPAPRDLTPTFVLAQDLHLRRADGSKDRTILVSTRGGFDSRETSYPGASDYQARSRGGIALIPPVWSPDGRYLAYYLVTEKDDDNYTYVLYTIRTLEVANPSDLADRDQRRIGTVISRLDAIPPRPSWSPDGRRIAFVADDESDRGLFTAQADGSERRQVASDPGIREVGWSPDGSEILLVSDRPYLVFVSPDGANRRQLDLSPALGEGVVPGLVVWSPDGSRIAIQDPRRRLLVTMDRDGGAPRTLHEGVLRRPAVDPAVCSAGVVVPEPAANPGLVRDCQTLLESVETLAGDSNFRWRADLPITRWVGVHVEIAGSEGLPLRVRSLNLEWQGLAGSIPPELGDLDALEILHLKNSGLRGPIPPELAKLTSLTHVDISNTGLTGCIPPGFSQVWVTGSKLLRCRAASAQ